MAGIADGFWGLVEDGMEVRLIDDQATLVKDGHPLVDAGDVGLSGLVRAEEAVALLGPTGMHFAKVGALVVASAATADLAGAGGSAPVGLGFASPASIDAAATDAIRDRLMQLGEQWRELDNGQAMTLAFVRPPCRFRNRLAG